MPFEAYHFGRYREKYTLCYQIISTVRCPVRWSTDPDYHKRNASPSRGPHLLSWRPSSPHDEFCTLCDRCRQFTICSLIYTYVRQDGCAPGRSALLCRDRALTYAKPDHAQASVARCTWTRREATAALPFRLTTRSFQNYASFRA